MNSVYAYYATLAVLAAGMLSGTGPAYAQVPETVRIGGVFDVTGNWSLEGEEGKTAAEFAVEDFNRYLTAMGQDWSFEMLVEDAQANASVALDKIQTLKGTGIDLLVGVGFSSHIQLAKSYIDSNNMLAISHGSQAANLAIDDSIFRLRPDDSNQAPVINAMLKDAGIEVLATVNRDDTWGNGLKDGVLDIFDGDTVELLSYPPDAIDFSVEVSILDEDLGKLIDKYGADKVGVLYVGTQEFLQIVQQANPYENIPKVRWFGSNTQSSSTDLVEDPFALKFTQRTQFTAVRAVSEDNSIRQSLDARIMEKYDRATSPYSYSAYDSVWLLGTAILHTQSTDVATLTAAIPLVANHTLGSIGPLELNAAGDLAGSTYQVWKVVNGQWVKYANYNSATMSLVY